MLSVQVNRLYLANVWKQSTGFSAVRVLFFGYWIVAFIVTLPTMTLWAHTSAWNQNNNSKTKARTSFGLRGLFVYNIFGVLFWRGMEIFQSSGYVVKILIDFSVVGSGYLGRFLMYIRMLRMRLVQNCETFPGVTHCSWRKISMELKDYPLLCCTGELSHSRAENSILWCQQGLNYSNMVMNCLNVENLLLHHWCLSTWRRLWDSPGFFISKKAKPLTLDKSFS